MFWDDEQILMANFMAAMGTKGRTPLSKVTHSSIQKLLHC